MLVCGATFYHTGSILLLRTGYIWQNDKNVENDLVIAYSLKNTRDGGLTTTPQYNTAWHAKELGGISTSNTSHANWVNQLQPPYIAGQVLGNSLCGRQNVKNDSPGEEEHPAEKIALLKHLAKIERETGWRTSGRAAEQRRLWGIE
jgi:hypothetical protein